jgi:hypothetical protein
MFVVISILRGGWGKEDGMPRYSFLPPFHLFSTRALIFIISRALPYPQRGKKEWEGRRDIAQRHLKREREREYDLQKTLSRPSRNRLVVF